jgi:molybdate transport system substrate-binding protein
MIWRFIAIAATCFTTLAHAQSDPLLVGAAASLSDALRELSELYRPHSPAEQIAYQFAGSGTLQRQIENGAPVDIFISAAPEPMDALEKQNLLDPGSRVNLLSNSLVLVTLAETASINGFTDLADAKVKHVAIGDPRTVPAGAYATQVFTALKLPPELDRKLVRLLDVRQVLASVVSGNADAGVVYQSDAFSSKKVRVAAVAPPGSHAPIVYPMAVMKRSRRIDDARRFANFLRTEEASAVFRKHHFNPVE